MAKDRYLVRDFMRLPLKAATMSTMGGMNHNNSPLPVKWADLKPDNETRPFKFARECPLCKVGSLLVSRDQETLKVIAHDYCILCGQEYIYTDIDDIENIHYSNIRYE